MWEKKLKTFVLASVLCCWLCLQPGYADIVLTDSEAKVLRASLTSAQTTLQEQQDKIAGLQKSLQQAQDLQKELQTTIETQQNRLTTLSQSYNEQKKEQRISKVKAIWIALGIGAAVGVAGGYYLAH